MATRFYFTSTTTTALSAAISTTWNFSSSGGVPQIKMVGTKTSSAASTIADTSARASGTEVAMLRGVIGPIDTGCPTITAAATAFKVSMKWLVSSSASFRYMCYTMRIIQSNGSTVRTVMTNAETYRDGVEIPTSTASRYEDFSIAVDGTPLDGDYLEIVIGFDNFGGSVNRTTTLSYGDDAGSDLDAADADTTGDGWVEFDVDIPLKASGSVVPQMMMTGVGT